MSSFVDDAKEFEGKIIGIRRKLHQNPELSFKEEKTARLVTETLRSLGIAVRTNVGGKGVVGLLEGAHQGHVVGLRADMDALPLDETSGVDFESRKRGVMHACGHDTHVAMLLGAAMVLARHRKKLQGAVKFLFQPAEEAGDLGGGAQPMIDDGALENPKVEYVFGLHIFTNYPSATFAIREGAIMASSGTFKIRISGPGGHGSAPHQTIDPVYAAAQVITNIQAVSSRMIDPVEPFVVSVCSIHSGTKSNIIPTEAVLEGTFRTVSESTNRRAKTLISGIAKDVSKAFGARCEVAIVDSNPITVNNSSVTRKASGILRTIPGTRTLEIPPILAAEDFSKYLQRVPGSYYFLGTRNKAKGCVYPNHSAKFKVDEDVLKYGSASLAMLAIEFASQD
jgi:carboxypeptidase Ss1